MKILRRETPHLPCSALVPNTRLIQPLDPSAGAARVMRSSSSRLAMASWRTRYSDRSAWRTSASVTMRLVVSFSFGCSAEGLSSLGTSRLFEVVPRRDDRTDAGQASDNHDAEDNDAAKARLEPPAAFPSLWTG